MRPQLRRLLAATVGSFLVISAAGLLMSWLWGPTTSPARHVAFEATMFAVTGATVAGVVVICGRRTGE